MFLCHDPQSHFRDTDMETGWVIVIACFSSFALIVCIFKYIAWMREHTYQDRVYNRNVKYRIRERYREDEKDAKETAQIQNMLHGKTHEQEVIIMRQYHAKKEQGIIDKHLKEKQEQARYDTQMENATPEQQSAMIK